MATATATVTFTEQFLAVTFPETMDIEREFEAWSASQGNSRASRDRFYYLVSTVFPEGRRFGGWSWCYQCSARPAAEYTTNHGYYCTPCKANWVACTHDGCTNKQPSLSTVTGADGQDVQVCGTCRDNRYLYCAKCETYYSPDYPEGYETHLHICNCLREHEPFTVISDGQALPCETRTTITPQAGVISQMGLRRLISMLQVEGLYYHADHVCRVGDEWQTREGNFMKRLSKSIHKAGLTKLSTDMVAKLGTEAAKYVAEPVPVHLEFTRNFARTAQEFHHAGSCWWNGYEYSKCTLKSLGGFGIRTFLNAEGDETAGRAWVIPIKRNDDGELRPTTDTEGHEALLVFNGYGNLAGMNAARLLAEMNGGWASKLITLDTYRMSVNNGNGFLVGPADLVDDASFINLYVNNKHDKSKVIP